MPDPITIITTLHGLAEKLVKNIKSGQDAAKAQEILRLVGELQTEYFTLQQHILKIETDNAKLIQQMAALKSPNPKQQNNDTQAVVDLDEVESKMLVLVANTRSDITRAQVFAHFGLGTAKGDYHFEQLTKYDFVGISHFNIGGGGNRGPFYEATSKGREYLAKSGLL